MSIDVYQVNSFCVTGNDGNPAVVCLIPEKEPSSHWMQSVATQMNVSETAFVRRLAHGFKIRWFSPVKELPLCGHATLAAAHVLYENSLAIGNKISFIGIDNSFSAKQTTAGIELDFPAILCKPVQIPQWFSSAFDVEPLHFLQGPAKYLVEVASENEVRNLRPDYALLRQVADRGVIITSRSNDPAYDIVSRYFAAYVGVDEDPVTGAAHCCLGPYWSNKLNKIVLSAYQASPRGGKIIVHNKADRVSLIGRARTVLRGELLM